MIAIVDYGMGNLGSIKNMLHKIGTQSIITSNPEEILKAEKLILPGVGSFDSGIKNLAELGLIEILNQRVLKDKIPILGVCLGVQLMTIGSDEGEMDGLGWFDAKTIKFNTEIVKEKLLLPNIGWRDVLLNKPSKLYKDMYEDPRFYFVHTYHLVSNEPSDVSMSANYGYDYVVGLENDNIIGVQFHPEKSHKFGMKLYENFVRYY
jgi:glutamine amidotransferase